MNPPYRIRIAAKDISDALRVVDTHLMAQVKPYPTTIVEPNGERIGIYEFELIGEL